MDQAKIGMQIKNARMAKGLTQKELADKLSLSFQSVSKWENGVCVPDLATLKELCIHLNLDLNELLDIDKKEPKKNTKKFWAVCLVIGIFILLFIVGLILHFSKKDDFVFKKLTTTCSNFNLIGSIAYSEDKTSLYISEVSYCGEENNTVYEKIECNLYEKHNDNVVLISSCDKDKDITLKNFLRDVKINVDNYAASCKLFKTSDLYLEISAYNKDNVVTTYTIPLNFEDNC